MLHNCTSTESARKKIEFCLRNSLDKNYKKDISETDEMINGEKNKFEKFINYLLPKQDKRYINHLNEITDGILKIHGLTKDNLDVIARFENELYSEGGIVDNSIDENANKSFTTTQSLLSEVQANQNKIIGYRYLYRELNTLYGTKRAQELMGELYNYSLAINDSTKILIPYCFAMDASSLITTGRQFGQLHSSPSKHLHSYISTLCEVVHSFTNQIAGALAVGTFFFDIAYILQNMEGVPLEVLKSDAKYTAKYKDEVTGEDKEIIFSGIRKYIENEMQSFVFSMNSLTRSTYESPFTNISVFSPSKIKTLLSDEGRSWYLETTEIENNENATKEEKLAYMIEYVLEIQNIFMDFFDKGDVLKGGINYRFPVVTINVSKEETGDESKKYKIVDEDKDFVDSICHREIYRYNHMISKGTKIASCCRLITNTKTLNEFGAQVNSFGGSATSYGSHRVVVINFPRLAIEAKSLPDYFEREVDKIFKVVQILHAHRHMLEHVTCTKKLHPFFANGWISMNRLFSTIGVIGIAESVDILIAKIKSGVIENTTAFKINKNVPKNELANNLKELKRYLISETLVLLNDQMRHYSEESEIYKNPFNIEQIPGESMAVRLCEADKLIFGNDMVPYELYSNQFIPLWENASLWERMKSDGEFNDKFTGGGIVHFNLGERCTPEQAKEIYEYSVESGSEHFALNPIYSLCKNNHSTFGNVETCPTCGEKITEKYTRVVGFFVPVSAFNKVRRNWEFPKRKFTKISELKK